MPTQVVFENGEFVVRGTDSSEDLQPTVPEDWKPRARPKNKPRPAAEKGMLDVLGNNLRYELNQLQTDPGRSAQRLAGNVGRLLMNAAAVPADPGTSVKDFGREVAPLAGQAATISRMAFSAAQRMAGAKKADPQKGWIGSGIDRAEESLYQLLGAKPPSQMNRSEAEADQMQGDLGLQVLLTVLGPGLFGLAGRGAGAVLGNTGRVGAAVARAGSLAGRTAGGVARAIPGGSRAIRAAKTVGGGRIAKGLGAWALGELGSQYLTDNTGGGTVDLINALGHASGLLPKESRGLPGGIGDRAGQLDMIDAANATLLGNALTPVGVGVGIEAIRRGFPATTRWVKAKRAIAREREAREKLIAAGVLEEAEDGSLLRGQPPSAGPAPGANLDATWQPLEQIDEQLKALALEWKEIVDPTLQQLEQLERQVQGLLDRVGAGPGETGAAGEGTEIIPPAPGGSPPDPPPSPPALPPNTYQGARQQMLDRIRGTRTTDPEQIRQQLEQVNQQIRALQDGAGAGPGGAGAAGESGVRFRTAMGSTYIESGGKTTRDKAARNIAGHEGDSGVKEISDKTIYVNPGSLLSSAGLTGAEKPRVVLRDGKATLLTWNEAENRWGAADSGRDIPYFDRPAVGLEPLELWGPKDDVPGYEAYGRMHQGNVITEIIPPATEAAPGNLRGSGADAPERSPFETEEDPWDDDAPEVTDLLKHVEDELTDEQRIAILNSTAPVMEQLQKLAADPPPPLDVTKRFDLAAFPTEALSGAYRQGMPGIDGWETAIEALDPAALKALADPANSPELAEKILALTGKDAGEATRADILDAIRSLSEEGRTVIPERLSRPDGTTLMRPEDIRIDTARFQSRSGPSTLQGEEQWNPRAEGIITVWRDPADGLTYVVDGHSRLDLAKRTGAPSVVVRQVDASSADAARAFGAITNISEGTAAVEDAANFMRGAGIDTPETVSAAGMAGEQSLAPQALEAIAGTPRPPEEPWVDDFRLPRRLAAKPLYFGDTTLKFSRDIDKAAYLLTDLRRSGNKADLTTLRTHLRGQDFNPDAMVQHAQAVRQAVANAIRAKGRPRDVSAEGGEITVAPVPSPPGGLTAPVRRKFELYGDFASTKQRFGGSVLRFGSDLDKGAFMLADAQRSGDKTTSFLLEGLMERAGISPGEALRHAQAVRQAVARAIREQGARKAYFSFGDYFNPNEIVVPSVELAPPKLVAPSKRLTLAEREAANTEIARRAMDEGGARPPTTPIPDLPPGPAASPDEALKDLGDNGLTPGGPGAQAIADEIRLRREETLRDAATAREGLEAIRESQGYDEKPFQEKVASGLGSDWKAPKPAPVPDFPLPKWLARRKQYFGDATLKFSSDIDTVAYSLTDLRRTGDKVGLAQLNAQMKALGINREAMAQHSRAVRQAVADAIRAKGRPRDVSAEGGEITIPQVPPPSGGLTASEQRAFKLPGDMIKETQRFGMSALRFESDLDKGAYMMAEAERVGNKGAFYVLEDAMKAAGITKKKAAQHARDVRRAVAQAIRAGGARAAYFTRGEIVVPRVERGAPAAATPLKGPVRPERIQVSTPPAQPAFKLPADLAGAKPRYGRAQLVFESDLDKTAYILLSDEKKASRQAQRYRDLAEAAGFNKEALRAHGLKVKAAIGEAGLARFGTKMASEMTGELRIPPVATRLMRLSGNPADYMKTPEGARIGLEEMRQFLVERKPELEAKVKEIVKKVGGKDAEINFRDAYENYEASEFDGWGAPDGEVFVKGWFDHIYDIVTINGMMEGSEKSIVATAYHESFHRLQYMALTKQQLNTLDSSEARAWIQGKAEALGYGDISYTEQQAVVFEHYAMGRRAGRSPMFALSTGGKAGKTTADAIADKIFAIYEAIMDYVQRFKSVLKGGKFESVRSIYEIAYQGHIADEWKNSRELRGLLGYDFPDEDEPGPITNIWGQLNAMLEDPYEALDRINAQIEEIKTRANTGGCAL